VATLAELEDQLAAVNAQIRKKEKAAAYYKEYCDANKEAILIKRSAYREANREQIRAKAETYREANRERIRLKAKTYYEVNKQRVSESTKSYYEKNPDKRLIQNCRTHLSTQLGCRSSEVPPELLEAKLAILNVTRKIKELSK
jgi:hypothetical protein